MAIATVNGVEIYYEIQGSGEESTFSETELATMLSLGKAGIQSLFALQRAALA